MNDNRYGRKVRNIKRALEDKIEHWLATIEDVDLQQLMRNNVIVTGGSIASMLMGEKVNDYDVYFRDIYTTTRVANYYVNMFNRGKHTQRKEEENGVGYTPQVQRERIKNIQGQEEERVIIFMKSAGIAAENQGEYNYFEQMGEGEAEEFVKSTLQDVKDDEDKPPYRPVFMSQNAITLSDKIQIVIRFYGEPHEIHANYDFVHACCWYDHKPVKLETPVEALQAMMARNLVYQGSLYPVASIFRAKKFLERGWRINAGQLLKIMWQISEINLQDYATLREQLTGVDMAYMWEICEALKSVDPEKINSAYIAEIIDRIFG